MNHKDANPKEQFLSVLHGDAPSRWLGYAFHAFPPGFPVIWDSVTMLDAANSGTYVDLWGATWRHDESDPGAIPIVTQENKVIKDLKNWRDYVKFPDLTGLDWTGTDAQLSHVDREKFFVMVPSFYGPFERLHALMPFDEVLLSMYDEPELVYEILSALTDWKIEALGRVIDHVKPDIIHSHDDWGSKTSLFFSPAMFREVLKPHYTRLYRYIKSRGVLVQHHADCFCQGLERDMVDMGIDMWQGAVPSNDIVQMIKNTEGKLLILGGIDQEIIDHADADEADIRAEVRRAIDAYAPAGSYLPCAASVVPVHDGILDIVVDECDKYGEIWLRSHSE
ncbi:MAG: hypothetical protein LBN35_03965 [Clostridiales Family XIII bacterium]|jgi:hypothetical protein|nr:hypothetical protein [Clostridiales Family XIII bacterium]